MALVTHFEPCRKDRTSVHLPTRCLCTIVNGTDGERYLQLDTLGSSNRLRKGQISQSIQLNRQAAQQLLRTLRDTFSDLD